ncbi:MAG: hypothetical protein FGM21_08440 [Limnohabitans sp.]|nr:hypothetical protein [Limnohabitans sp.]
MSDLLIEIAATAARMVVEEGLEYGAAKQRAVKQMRLPPRTPLPSNDLLEAEVRDYLELFCADTQPGELRALRELALVWMKRLEVFRPHLGGAVWRGTATRLSDIYLQLFCDDGKSTEIELINQGCDYQVTRVTGFQGQPVDALSLSVACPPLKTHVGLHLLIHDHDDLRGALKPDAQGRSWRGDVMALQRILEAE